MSDNQRIEQLKKHLGLSANALSKVLELPNPQIFYDIKAGKCGISKELATKIKDKYLNISAAWLLTGEGEMIKTEPPKIGSQQSSEMVAMPRELLDLLLSQQRTMEMQQKTVEAQQRITESQQGNFAKLTEAITELAKKGGNVEKPFRAASVVVEDE